MQIKLKDFTFKIEPGQNKHYWMHINSIDWEPHTFSIFDYFINKNSIVLDIGSWSGVLSLYAAKIAKEVHALDPDPICYSELERNVALNATITNKINTYQVAISNTKKMQRLFAREAYGQSSTSILSRKRDLENSIEIETISLLEFIERFKIKKVDFIKMDVEGAEFIILPTIEKALNKLNYPTFYVSFHYSFLNEHYYNKTIKSKLLNKVFIKLENTFGFSLFKKRIHKDILNLYKGLKPYKYIYKTDGSLILFEELIQNPELIKETDLVFTNVEWKI